MVQAYRSMEALMRFSIAASDGVRALMDMSRDLPFPCKSVYFAVAHLA